jgi:hypothetical protein
MKPASTFSSIRIGSAFRWAVPPHTQSGITIDYTLIKGSATTCGPTKEDQIWEVTNPSSRVIKVRRSSIRR